MDGVTTRSTTTTICNRTITLTRRDIMNINSSIIISTTIIIIINTNLQGMTSVIITHNSTTGTRCLRVWLVRLT